MQDSALPHSLVPLVPMNNSAFVVVLLTCYTICTHGMRLVVQKVKSASVSVEGTQVSSIGPGVLALVGLHENDTDEDLVYCSKRLLAAKLWPNENNGQWRHGVKQKELEILCVSQFTLYGKLSKKFQPDFKYSMKAVPAKILYDQFLDTLRQEYQNDKVFDGVFGAMMDVQLVNDGPVTIIIESDVQQQESLQDDTETTDEGSLHTA